MTRVSGLRVVALALALVLAASACQGWPFRTTVTPTIVALEAPTETPTEATAVPTETSVPTGTTAVPTEVPATSTPLPTPTETTISSTPVPTLPPSPTQPVPTNTPAATAVVPVTTAAPVEPVYHIVQWGENLTRVAMRYGVTVQALAAANGIWNADCIWAGMKLWIPTPGAVTPQTYTVQTGDTLYSIAQRFGTTVWAIAWTNGIWDVSYIRVGQVLLMPASAPVPAPGPWARLYVVQTGDTLSGIAWRFGSTVWALAQANGIVFPDLIYIGQTLYIP